jgi:tripartite-type tricarboxylate transporter receptor subunit TctC
MKRVQLQRRQYLRKSLGTSLAVGALCVNSIRPSFANKTTFPNRPITLIVPWPAGGSTDVSMRLLADIAGKELKQNIIVENRSGASGTMAMPILQAAAPDGYTIAQLPLTIYRAPYTAKVSWDPIRDVTPILQISGVTFGIVVPAQSPFQSLEDILAFAKKNPSKLTIATNGIGTTPHLVIEELFEKLGLSYLHVPYKGTAEQMVAVAGGHIMVGVNSTGFGPYVESAKLRLLVTFGEQRTKRWPYAPTLKELGFGIVALSPYGLGGPKGMPTEITHMLHDAFKIAIFHPAHIAEVAKYDQEIAYLNTDDYARFARIASVKEKQWAEKLGLAPR